MHPIRRLPTVPLTNLAHRTLIAPQTRSLFGLGTVKRKNEVMSYGERRLIGFTAEQMFDVVFTVAEYPKFVPWCKRADVKKLSDRVFEAELHIGFPPLNEHYSSRVTALYPNVVRSTYHSKDTPNSMSILQSVCTEGQIFSLMETVWRFGPAEIGYPPNSCSLDFTLDFQFKSILHAQLAQALFGQVVRKMVCAFLKRAEHLYGEPSFNHFTTEVQIQLPK